MSGGIQLRGKPRNCHGNPHFLLCLRVILDIRKGLMYTPVAILEEILNLPLWTFLRFHHRMALLLWNLMTRDRDPTKRTVNNRAAAGKESEETASHALGHAKYFGTRLW